MPVADRVLVSVLGFLDDGGGIRMERKEESIPGIAATQNTRVHMVIAEFLEQVGIEGPRIVMRTGILKEIADSDLVVLGKQLLLLLSTLVRQAVEFRDFPRLEHGRGRSRKEKTS